MKKLSIICSLLFVSILSFGQSITCPVGPTCNVLVTGPSQTGGPVTITLEVNNPTPPQLDDILLWAAPLAAQRTTQHLSGTLNKSFWLDSDRLAWTKGSLGNPQDYERYDNNFFYHWITENGDSADTATCIGEGYAGGCFTNPFAYKRFLSPVSIAPRFFDTTGASGDVIITHAGPNHSVRTTNCEVDAQPLLSIGNVAGVTHYAGLQSYGGNLGTQNTVIIYWYWGLSSITPPLTVFPYFQSGHREDYYLIKGTGQVKWILNHFDVPSGQYVQDQVSLNNNIVVGGAPVPFVPCGQIAGAGTWWTPYTETDNNGNNLSSVTIALASNSINVSTSTTGTGTGHYSGGGTLDVTNGIYWTSSNNAIAAPTFNRSDPQNIACTALGGTVTITGTAADGHAGTASLTCNAAAPPCMVSITPTTASVLINASQTFTPTVTNCSPSTVTWKVNGIIGGNSTVGTITTGGVYTAPAVVPSPNTVTVAAVSNADPTKSDTSSVVITAPLCSVTISPLTAGLLTGGSQSFTSTVSNCTPSTVHWQVNGVTGGNSTVGTITTGGLYTTPALVPTPNTVTVTDVSDQDNTTHGTASVTITAAPICSVSIVPLLATVKVGLTQQFTGSTQNCSPATLTWKVNGVNGGNSTVGTVSGAGLYTAPAAIPTTNPVTVTAVSNADATKLANASVTIVTTSTSVMDLDCLKGNVPSFGVNDGPAVLPKTCYYTDPSVTTPTGTVRPVTSNATWTTAWTAAQCGDIIEVAVGTVLTNVTIPTKSCTGYIWLRSAGYTFLPPYGTMFSPCYAGVASLPGRPNFNCVGTPTNRLFTIKTVNGSPALAINTNTTFIRITGAEITRTAGTGITSTLIAASTGGVNHLILDDDWCHGVTLDETNNCITVNRISYFAAINDFMNDFHCTSVSGTCTDAKPIGGGSNGNATDTDCTYKIVGNFLEGAGQTILFGGGAAAIVPCDIEIRNNIMFKPLIWDPADPSYNGGSGGNPFIVKNLFELKNAQRVLIEGNIMSNVWAGFSQVGDAFVLTPKNQAGSGTSNICPICQVNDITIRYNQASSVGQAFQIANVASDNGGFGSGGFDYSIHDNSVDNINFPTCFKCASSTAMMTFFENTNTPLNFILHHVLFNHNTIVRANAPIVTPGFAIGISGGVGALQMHDFTFTNNVFAYGTFGATTNNSGGNKSCGFQQQDATGLLNACFANFTGGGIAAINSRPAVVWPGSNCLSVSTNTAMFVSYNNGLGGNYTLTSTCHNTGTDGKDPGADLVKLNATISTVHF